MLETSLNADIRSGQIGSVCVLILAILLGSLPSAFAADAVACAVPPPQPADALKAIEAISTIDSPALTPTTRIVPAGTSADFAVQKRVRFNNHVSGCYKGLLRGVAVRNENNPKTYSDGPYAREKRHGRPGEYPHHASDSFILGHMVVGRDCLHIWLQGTVRTSVSLQYDDANQRLVL